MKIYRMLYFFDVLNILVIIFAFIQLNVYHVVCMYLKKTLCIVILDTNMNRTHLLLNGGGVLGVSRPIRSKLSSDAPPQKIINTLRLLSGVGATCVLKTPHNSSLDSTLDQLAQTLNPSANESKTLAAHYFDSMCLDSFTQGVPLSNFVPPPPSPAPSDDPDPRFDEDGVWNFTTPPTPTAAHGRSRPDGLPSRAVGLIQH